MAAGRACSLPPACVWAIVVLTICPQQVEAVRDVDMENSRSIGKVPQDFVIGRLCAAEVTQVACKAMGNETGHWATEAQLAEVLALDNPRDVAPLLYHLGIPSVGPVGTFNCQELCTAAVAMIPVLLGQAIPRQAGAACIDNACELVMENVSEETLLREGLGSPPPHEDMVEVPSEEVAANSSTLQLEYPQGPADMLRVALNVLFGIFPAPNEDDDDNATSLLQSVGSSHEGDDNPEVTFGPNIRSSRHERYRRAAIKAAAWVATALRKLNARKALVKKWFRLETATDRNVELQIKESRKHMTKMLSALGQLYLIKGTPKSQGGSCTPGKEEGTVAYVQQVGGCNVKTSTACGTRKGSRYVVNICEFYWKFLQREQAGTLIHESSHHFGTKDHGYGEGKCMKLSQAKARENADTYHLFIAALAGAKGKRISGPSKERAKELREKLRNLVGLKKLKRAMDSMLDLVAFGKEREKRNLTGFAGQSLHMRFLGNPGTGKTVVARIVGELLMAMGAIAPKEGKSSGDGFVFREANRADLVAEYKGQTAPKVQKLVKEAFGGVLFIDEAYALVQGPRDTFGVEAVDTLIKEMEDNREHLIVILAGYNKEMEDFFNSNPGFKSRVPFSFDFEDYSCPELVEIGKLQLGGKGLALPASDACDTPGNSCWWLQRSIQLSTRCCDKSDKAQCKGNEDRTNGNGRTVRNVLEASFRRMALRVLKSIEVATLQKFTKAVAPSLREPSCEERRDINAGSYSGPDLRCDFKLLTASDIFATTVELANLNLASCKVSVKEDVVKKMAAGPAGKAWIELAERVAQITVARGESDESLEAACSSVKDLIDGWAGSQLVPTVVQSRPRPRPEVVPTVHINLFEDLKSGLLQEVVVEEEEEEEEKSDRSDSDELFEAPFIRGFIAIDDTGFCRNKRARAMRHDDGTRGVTLRGCAARCKKDVTCTAFATTAVLNAALPYQYQKCYIYRDDIPKYASGRSSVQCYRKRGATVAAEERTSDGNAWRPTRPTRTRRPTRIRPRPTPSRPIGQFPTKDEAEQAFDESKVDSDHPAVDALMAKLNGLVGLVKVKAGMNELHAMVQFDRWRKVLLPDAKSLMGQSFHMQFLGNPGTGKTVVARIVGELLVEMGVIAGSDETVFEEVARADLVAQYKGQTAPKVVGAVERAIGGVLFVDEAYSLKKEGKDTFGQEAVDTLIKEIEDKRDKVIAIFAGYEREMEIFFDSNPGFKSRVPFKFYFDDYTCSELRSIAGIFMKQKEFTASDSADLWLNRTIDVTTGCCETSDCVAARDNGNGRTVRNILEASYRNFASRAVPTIHAKKEFRSILERVEDFAEEKKVAKSKYKLDYGTKSWKSRWREDFAMEKVCSQEPSNFGGRSWAALCSEVKGTLKTLNGEDVALVAASNTVDMLLASCREERVNIGHLETVAGEALQVISTDDWNKVLEGIIDDDCQGVLDVFESVPDVKPLMVYDTLGLMENSQDLKPLLAKLQKLVGLENVKESMGKLYGLIKLSTWRKGLGMPSLGGQSFHMRFIGNPGTGKTVVARIVGEMLIRMGAVTMPLAVRRELVAAEREKAKNEGRKIARGEKVELPLIFKEVSRADLVASYLGQTAPKVEAAVKNATGGVLFIDEAYAIVRDGKDSFGQEAVDTLIKMMEDNRKTVVVILAGYEKEMDTFFDANPGFKSRVPLTFRFEDYSCRELAQIGNIFLSSRGISPVGDQISTPMEKLITFATGCCDNIASADCHPSRENGNGRTARNIVEALSRAMATRVMHMHTIDPSQELSVQDLTKLQAADVKAVAEEQAAIRLQGPCGSSGFLEQLRKALAEESGLRDWFAQYKLSNPRKRLHTLMRETGRMTASLSAFSSSKLSQLQDQCNAGLTDTVEAMRKKALHMCGNKSTSGVLAGLAYEVESSTERSVEDFKALMDKIESSSMEAMLLRKLTRGAVPPQMKSLKDSDRSCLKSIEGLLSKQLLMPLTEAVKKLSDKY